MIARLGLLALVACHPTLAATPRAVALVDRQVAALLGDDATALAATIDMTAMIMRPAPTDHDSAMAGLRAAMLGLDPHDEFKAVKVDGLVVHGTDRAIAVDFDLVVTKVVHEESPGEIETAIHVTELFVESAGWRAVRSHRRPRPLRARARRSGRSRAPPHLARSRSSSVPSSSPGW